MLGEILGAVGSIAGGLFQKDQAKKQADLQKEFAQSGIQWKVQDAEKAGIHPLYALGAQTTGYQPTAVGDLGLPDAGQNIGRAIDSTRSNTARTEALALTASQIQLEGLKLDNELKRAQLASAVSLAAQNQTSLPGPFTRHAMPGQGNTQQTDDGSLPLMHDAKNPQYTPNLRAFGKDIASNPDWSDAQSFEDRYGEMSDYVMGPAILTSDYFYNMRNARFGNPFNVFYKNYGRKR